MFFSRSLTRFGSSILLAIMISTALVGPVASAEESDACLAAETAASSNTPGALWFLAGCVGGWIGLAAAYLISPTPPATSLLGKSPEYVATYTDCYKRKGVGAQTKMAWTGCITATVLECGCYFIYAVALVGSTASTSDSSF